MLIFTIILMFMLILGWIMYFIEKNNVKFYKKLRNDLMRNIDINYDKKTRIDGDEWKDFCGY